MGADIRNSESKQTKNTDFLVKSKFDDCLVKIDKLGFTVEDKLKHQGVLYLNKMEDMVEKKMHSAQNPGGPLSPRGLN